MRMPPLVLNSKILSARGRRFCVSWRSVHGRPTQLGHNLIIVCLAGGLEAVDELLHQAAAALVADGQDRPYVALNEPQLHHNSQVMLGKWRSTTRFMFDMGASIHSGTDGATSARVDVCAGRRKAPGNDVPHRRNRQQRPHCGHGVRGQAMLTASGDSLISLSQPSWESS